MTPVTPDLHTIQGLMWRLVTWPEGVAHWFDQASPADRAAARALVATHSEPDAITRLSVYAEGYFWRLADVLGSDYPVVRGTLPEAEWHNLVTDYVWRRPSVDPSLRHFGARLPAFLTEHKVSADRPWLPELAALEWARGDVFDARDDPSAEAATLAACPPERWPELTFDLIDGLRILPLRYRVDLMWADRIDHPTGSRVQVPPRADASEAGLLIWRGAHRILFQRLSSVEEQAALLALQQGLHLEAIGARAQATAADPLDPQVLVGWLLQWFTDGLIARVHRP